MGIENRARESDYSFSPSRGGSSAESRPRESDNSLSPSRGGGSAESRPAESDHVRLTGLTVFGHHGVFDFEKAEGQNFVVDLDLYTDHRAAAAGDDLTQTIHYGELAEAVAAVVRDTRYDLIETLASHIAEVCLAQCSAVEVTVHKPTAPITETFADVSVSVFRRRSPSAVALVALGGNQGEVLATLRQAVSALQAHPRIDVLATSELYRTAPVGGVVQDDFHNAVLALGTELPAVELLSVCQGIEVAAGRIRDIHWGPRTLDLDLVRYVELPESVGLTDPEAALAVLDDPSAETRTAGEKLTLPHPLARTRDFVLVPWATLRPDARIATPEGIVPIDSLITAGAPGVVPLGVRLDTGVAGSDATSPEATPGDLE